MVYAGQADYIVLEHPCWQNILYWNILTDEYTRGAGISLIAACFALD
jgi:hypothetical protein